MMAAQNRLQMPSGEGIFYKFTVWQCQERFEGQTEETYKRMVANRHQLNLQRARTDLADWSPGGGKRIAFPDDYCEKHRAYYQQVVAYLEAMEVNVNDATILVTFCCNERGRFTGRVSHIYVGDDWLELEGPMEEVPDEGDGSPTDWEGSTPIQFSRRPQHHVVCIGDQEFPLQTYGTWIGNTEWNGGRMFPQDIAAMLNQLRALGGWSPNVAESNLMRKWERGETITPQDLGVPPDPDPPYVCPNTRPLDFQEAAAS